MWPKPQSPADLVTFTEEILNGKLHFLCSMRSIVHEVYERNILSYMFISKTDESLVAKA